MYAVGFKNILYLFLKTIHVIIDNEIQYQNFKRDIKNSDIIFIPIYTDNKSHVINNNILGVYINIINTSRDYLMLLNHDEKLYENSEIFTVLENHDKKIYVFDKKHVLHHWNWNNLFDLSLLSYLNTHKKPNYTEITTNAHKFLQNKYFKIKNVNILIPAVKHLELCRLQSLVARTIIEDNGIDDTYYIYNKKIIENFFELEKPGLKINIERFKEHFPDKIDYLTPSGYLYTDYNLYTATGRPSNSFGGINFAGLNKEDGSRSVIVSRFEEGSLVELDYSAFHPTLIAEMVGYQIPKNVNIYEYLGKQILGKEDITTTDIKDIKDLTFQLIYGGIYKEFESIPYFKIIKDYIYIIWNDFSKRGFVESNPFKRKIKREFFDDVNSNKLFNYILQLKESENNSIVLYKLIQFLKSYKSKAILYTYDSFLCDISPDEIFIIKQLKEIAEMGGKFPVKITIGKTYQTMEDYNEFDR